MIRSGDHNAATIQATNVNPENLSHPIPCLEMARCWLLIARAIGGVPNLSPDERERASNSALQNARKAAQAAQKKGLFNDPNQVRFFHSEKDFEPIWDLVARIPK